MSTASAADVCRVTVMGPRRRVDLALPSYVPFAELLPVIAGFAGVDQETARQAPGGWILQRLGQAPFPPESTPQQTGLRDGEMIYLRPREAQLPEVAFDDVADAIATGIGERPDRWGQREGRWAALGAGALALVSGVIALLVAGPPWTWPAVTAGTLAAALLGGAFAVSRAVGDPGAAALLGYLALPYAFLGGLLAPAGASPLAHFGAPGLLSGFAAALLAALLAAVAVADGTSLFPGMGFASLLGTLGAGLCYAFGSLGLAGAAALMAALALALSPVIPAIAFRLGRLVLPPVPRDAAELRQDTLTIPGSQVLARTAAADRVVTAMVSGIGLAGTGAAAALAFGQGWLPRLMCAVLGCALLLRCRVFSGRAQRLWLAVPGYGALALLAVATSLSASPGAAVVTGVVPLAAGAAILFSTGIWLSGHRPSPFWGRAAELIDMTLVVALVPLALGVAGVFGAIRGLSG